MTTAMTTFETLDQYLGMEFSDDYWSDEGIGQAQSMLQELGIEATVALSKVWEARGEEWQVRCAQILPHGELRQALKILLTMARKGARDVRIAALDSLRDTDLMQLNEADRGSVEDDARELLQQAGKVEATMLHALLKSLGKNTPSRS
jgi:hypothetical protein